MTEKTGTGYRPDIDGLRAIAVLSVVWFHAFPLSLKGGFVGVDIFFVISGFLISSLILRDLVNGDFSFADFYARRARRILPSLVLVLVSISVVAWFVCWPEEFRRLGKHLLGAATFVSNLILYNEAGYFDQTAELKPLRHLWSLAIEEQFYIVWPLLVTLLWKRTRKVLEVVCMLGLLSFALNIWLSTRDPAEAFYSPLTRFWELLLGAALAYVSLVGRRLPEAAERVGAPGPSRPNSGLRLSGRLCQWFGVVGSVMLCVALFVVDSGRPFPGWWALLPTAGTGLLIAAGPKAWINDKVLANPVLVFVGLVSYPLYLWHWPLIVATNVAYHGYPPTLVVLFVILLSLGLAVLTYRFVEIPIRNYLVSLPHTTEARVQFLLKTLTPLGAIAVSGLLVWWMGGIAGRFQDERERAIGASTTLGLLTKSGIYSQIQENSCGPIKLTDPNVACWKDRREPPHSIVLGNSKAHAIFPGLVAESGPGSRWLLVLKDGCGILNWKARTCIGYFNELISQLASNSEIRTVLLAFATRELYSSGTVRGLDPGSLEMLGKYSEDASSFIRLLEGAGKSVVLLVDHPAITDTPELCWIRPHEVGTTIRDVENGKCSVSVEDHARTIRPFRVLAEEAKRQNPRLLVYDPTSLLCDQSACRVTKNGYALYSYTDHYSDFGGDLVARGLLEYLTAASSSSPVSNRER